MLNTALLNKAENMAIGLASNALHLMLIFVTTPIFLYKNGPYFLFLYFRRSYKGTLPFLVTSSYLVRKCNFNDCHYDKNCVLYIMLTFAMTHIPALICYFLRSHIVTLPVVEKPSILARRLLYLWGFWQMNCFLHVMLIFKITLISWYESWPVFISCLLQIICSYIT